MTDPKSATYQDGEAIRILNSVRERLDSRVPAEDFRLVPPDPQLAAQIDYLLNSPATRYRVEMSNFPPLEIRVEVEWFLSDALVQRVQQTKGPVFRAETIAEIARESKCPLTKRLCYCLIGQLAKTKANPPDV